MIDEAVYLYGLAPGQFVAERNRVAKQLRAAGRADDAAIVAALRKPKIAENALNQLARHDPEMIEKLLVAAQHAERAQTEAIGGNSAGLREATAELRRRIAVAVDAAVHALNESGASGEGQRDEIGDLIRTAITVLPGLLRSGMLGSEAMAADDEIFRGVAAPPAQRERDAETAQPRAARRKDPTPTPPESTPQRGTAKERREQQARQVKLERAVRDADAKEADVTTAIDAVEAEITARVTKLASLRERHRAARDVADQARAALAAHGGDVAQR